MWIGADHKQTVAGEPAVASSGWQHDDVARAKLHVASALSAEHHPGTVLPGRFGASAASKQLSRQTEKQGIHVVGYGLRSPASRQGLVTPLIH